MSEAQSSLTDQSVSRRLRTTNTLMALVILVLLGQVAWQGMRISSLKADNEQTQREVTRRAVRLASGRDSSWTRPPIYVAMTCNESEAEK